MNKSKTMHAIRIYILVNVATALSALVELLRIPADPKNAWLLGYSQTRLWGAIILFLIAGGFVVLAIRSWYPESRIGPIAKSIQNHLGTRWLYDIYFFLFGLASIFSAIISARFRDYPEYAPNSYTIVRAYPFLIWTTVFALMTLILLIILRSNRNSGYGRGIIWLNEQLAKKYIEIGILIALSLIFLAIGRNHLSNTEIFSDNLEASKTAYYLRTSGSIASGIDENGIPILTSRREPLPAFVGAVNMTINPSFWREFQLSDVNSGDLIVAFKAVNLFWGSLFFVTAYFMAKRMFTSPLLAYLVSTALVYFLAIRSSHFDGGFHEVAAASLLLLTSLLVFRLLEKPERVNGIFFGISLSLLALTKSAFFYVGIAYFLVIALTWLLARKMTKKTFVVLLLAFLAFVLPNLGWMTRNYIYLDSFTLTERGGDVLYHRVLNTRHPMWGLLYAFSPPVFRDVISEFTDYREEDVLEGGRLGELITGNPSYIQYHRKNIYNQMVIDARLAGESISGALEVDRFLMEEAFKEILNDPGAYLSGTPGLALRGIWWIPYQYGFDYSNFSRAVILPIINLAIFVSFSLFIPYALIGRKYELAVVFFLPLGMYLFNTLLSHNQPRFNYSLHSYFWISALCFVFDAAAIAFGRKSDLPPKT